MSFKSPEKREKDEVEFLGELGWFSALAVAIATAAASIV